ncbi:MAG TPA: glycosyltransferase [Candidatus Bathyarchaeia archaeon]|nr:glycosyltransferase [Candidatus Bathyarchaeia archaeon]
MYRRNLRILVVKYAVVGLTDLSRESTTFKPLAALARRGNQVTFLAATTPRSARRRDVPGLKLELIRLPKEFPVFSLIFFEFAALWRVIREIPHSDAIILDYNSIPLLFPILFLHRLFSRTPILLLHIETNVVVEGNTLRNLAVSFHDALSMKLASILFDKIFFSSPMLAEFYRYTYRVSDSKIAVWPNVVEPEFAGSVDETKVELLRKELGLSGRLAVLYHGWLSRGRGIIELVEAFKLLKEEGVRAVLVLLGYGPQRESISEYVHANSLDEIVKLRGPVDHTEVPNYIAACDVGIVPLPDHIWWRYQCPVKVLEYLAMNKPMIVSDLPAHKWIIGNKPVALYLKGTDPRSIADGLREFLHSRDKFDPGVGRTIIEERFTPERVANYVESQIISLLPRPKTLTLHNVDIGKRMG